ncbi:LeuA family protein [Geochorda subterranea]|uniref:Pyruvate carboxyltransferase domain-containing protein n=1 Tax=Geochorda subterranea TaxID=3109564 RepID=A0ABZ1BS30_9FIRM|nr:hypothetical protein [Limnochorda sp. LNt]WRP15013.1 hypothetical protein VLY81_02225 [Limnochorda sp. LNt]
MSQATPWKSDDWFVSPWNYFPEVRSQFEFPARVRLHDVSLRDGEQQAGLVFNKDQKIRLAEKLAEVGVHRIEAGMPAVSPQDEAAIREIVRRNLGPEIFAFARCTIEDVKRAQDCGVRGVVVEIPSSEHIIREAYGWPVEKAIDLSIQATRFAHEQGLYTVFFPIDFSRADLEWGLTLLKRVATEGHMDALVVVDTFGVLSPHAVPYLIRRIKAEIDKPLECHFHNDFGMGVANTVMALASGCEVAHTTIAGIGERAGNTPYEELALALLMLYGVDMGLRCDRLYETARLLQEIAGIQIPTNRAVIGEMLYDIESGIIASWYRNCYHRTPTEIFPVRAEFIGREPARVVMGKGSGADNVRLWLEEDGLDATDEQVMELVALVKQESLAKGRLLTRDEFRSLALVVLSPARAG